MELKGKDKKIFLGQMLDAEKKQKAFNWATSILF